MDNNYWSEFEYSKLKLLLNIEKVDSIIKVLEGEKRFDEMPPISVELHLTNLCNLNCKWCTDKVLKEDKASSEKESILKLFDYFAEHNVGVTIEGGGEPSVHPDFEEIVRYGYEKGLHMGLISNGVNDFSHLAKCFKWIRISVDASNVEEYELEKGVDKFDTVIENLKKISKAREASQTHLGVGYVMTKRNITGIIDFLKGLDDIGIDYVYARPVEEAPDITPSIEELLRLKTEVIKTFEDRRIKVLLVINERFIKDNDNLPCVAHSLSCIIRANGDVALCEKRRHDPIIFGSINEKTFDQIWYSENRQEASRKLTCSENQKGCEVCRMTSFNQMLCDLKKLNTKRFI